MTRLSNRHVWTTARQMKRELEMKSAISLACLLALVTMSCGGAPAGEDLGPSPVSSLSQGTVNQLDELCGQAADAIGDGRLAAAADILQPIPQLVNASPEGKEIEGVIEDLSEILAGEPDEFTEDQIRRLAPLVGELSNRLYVLGAGNCPSLEEALSVHLSPPPSDSEQVRAVAENQRELWRSQGITTYHYLLSPHLEESLPEQTEPPCGTFGWVVIQVVDGEPELAVDKFSGCEIDPEEAQETGLPLTIEELFDLVVAHSDADQIQVDYDPSLGYPKSVFVQGKGMVFELSVQELAGGRADLSGVENILDELDTNHSLWATHAIGTYTLTIEVGCFCPPEFRGPFTVRVEDGEIIEATFQDKPIEIEVHRLILTVDGLFEFVEGNAYADQIQVTYHPELGYPEVIDVDPVRQAIDEEIRVTVLELTTP